jgi:hypothetical protein
MTLLIGSFTLNSVNDFGVTFQKNNKEKEIRSHLAPRARRSVCKTNLDMRNLWKQCLDGQSHEINATMHAVATVSLVEQERGRTSPCRCLYCVLTPVDMCTLANSCILCTDYISHQIM